MPVGMDEVSSRRKRKRLEECRAVRFKVDAAESSYPAALVGFGIERERKACEQNVAGLCAIREDIVGRVINHARSRDRHEVAERKKIFFLGIVSYGEAFDASLNVDSAVEDDELLHLALPLVYDGRHVTDDAQHIIFRNVIKEIISSAVFSRPVVILRRV